MKTDINFSKFLTKRNKFILAGIFITGMIFMLLYGKVSTDSADKGIKNVISNETETEEKVKKILSEIKGAGDVDVMINFEGSRKTVYASDVSLNGGREEKKIVTSGGEAIPVNTKNPEVKGVIVVCEGANSPGVKKAVTDALCAGLGISESKIGVFEKN